MSIETANRTAASGVTSQIALEIVISAYSADFPGFNDDGVVFCAENEGGCQDLGPAGEVETRRH
jgi:hypothetical protein